MSFSFARFQPRTFFETKIPSALRHEVSMHFAKVYSLITAMLLLCVYGAYQGVALGAFFSLLICFVCLLAILLLQPKDTTTQFIRLGCFALMSYVLGSSLVRGGVVGWVLSMPQGSTILQTALLGTVVIFVSFSVGALLAPPESLVWLPALLALGVSILATLAHWIVFSFLLFGVYLEGAAVLHTQLGLLVLIGFLVWDTQCILTRVRCGDYDYVKHALLLFYDFLEIFVRLLTLVARNSKKKK
jgi:FtsH-binding integral membrane protein